MWSQDLNHVFSLRIFRWTMPNANVSILINKIIRGMGTDQSEVWNWHCSQVGYGLSVHYTVLSTKNGNPLDISFQLKDSNHKMLFFQVRKKEDFVSNHTVNTAGDYEMCFNNRFVYKSQKSNSSRLIHGVITQLKIWFDTMTIEGLHSHE